MPAPPTGPLPHINISAVDARGPLVAIQQAVAGAALVDSFGGLHRLLTEMITYTEPRDATLDLIGPSTGNGTLQLATSAIDSTIPDVLDVAEDIGRDKLLQKLQIREVRLIGSRTAVEQAGQDTMRRLAQLFGVPVRGTTTLVCRDHFREHGYDWDLDPDLVDDRSLPPRKVPPLWPPDADAVAAPGFAFDRIAIVKESALPPVAWPRFVIPRGFDIRGLLGQIRATEGKVIVGLLALPRCELLIPAGRMLGENRYRVIEVLLNWELVRILTVEQTEGAVYPIISPSRLVRLFISLPQYQP